MFIQTESTPNPLTIKFLPGRVVMESGTIFFQNKSESINSPLAEKIFLIDGIVGVFFGSDFISITKKETHEWQVLKPLVIDAITNHYDSGLELINKDSKNINSSESESLSNEKDTEVVKQIKELIETKVRPAVAMDGGDIIYQKFEEGIVYLDMQGACSGCPSSTATLKVGIENMLKHYVPEVKEVKPINVK